MKTPYIFLFVAITTCTSVAMAQKYDDIVMYELLTTEDSIFMHH